MIINVRKSLLTFLTTAVIIFVGLRIAGTHDSHVLNPVIEASAILMLVIGTMINMRGDME